MKKAVAWRNLHFCEAEGLEPSCLPVPLPPTTAVVCSSFRAVIPGPQSALTGLISCGGRNRTAASLTAPLRSSIPSRQTK